MSCGSSRDSGFFIFTHMSMAKTRVIMTGIQSPDGREDIPSGVDAFLRALARWTVEDVQRHKTTQEVTNSTLSEENGL